ncbi:MAG: YbdK family carboxylate-amine ligase [Thermoleophilia bacterium]
MAGAPPSSAILDGVREKFEASTDFTVGLEEEYQLLDPVTLGLVNRYEQVVAAADPALRERLAGELIASEVEFKTTAHPALGDAAAELARGRRQVTALLDGIGLATAITGTHPFSPWADQRIIDTPHYRLVEGELGYIAWINNTWALHLHCGVRGADRAVRVSTAMRSVLPELLALSANSPFLDRRDTRLASARTQRFVRSFPRCGIPDAYTSWDEYAAHVRLLEATGSIRESTQIWWSVRPHHSFGTVEVRICDGQTEFADAVALAALSLACIAAFCADIDAGRPVPVHPRALIEENLWRAQRHGLEGGLIDLDRGVVRPAPDAIRELLARTADHHDRLGLTPHLGRVETLLGAGNGAMRQRSIHSEHRGDMRAVHAAAVARTRESAQEFLSTLTTGATS